MSEASEEAIWIARCLRGEPAAFEALVVKHQRVVFGLALRLVGDYEDARDATQNAFIRAYEHLETFDLKRSFFSWIYRIAVNECLNFRRARRTHEPLPDLLAAPLVKDPIEAGQLSDRVRSALKELTAEQRDVVMLKYFAELSYEEISGALGVPEKTVKSRLFTARQRLGARLATSEGPSS